MNMNAPRGEFGRKDAGQASENDVKALSVELKKVTDEIKTFAEAAQKELKTHGKVAEETKAKADEALVKQADLSARLDEVEQKLAKRKGGGGDKPQTLGQQVVSDEQVKAFMGKVGVKGSVSVEVKAITSAEASAGVLVQEQRVPGIVAPPERRMTVRDLLTPGRTDSNSIQYVQETGFTNAAATVSEGAQKPQSDITFALVNTSVTTIAHWVIASRQILADASMLQSYIDGRLRYGLMYVEELQLLKGDGTGTNLHGIIPQASAYNPAFTPANMTQIDQIRLAMLQATLAEYPATGTVMHPTDWARIELTKDQEGRYIFANPVGLAGPVLWGRPVVETQAMDELEFLVGAFRLGAQIFDRENANVAISTEDRDNFVKNMVTILAEERLTLAVYRPEAFITGQFEIAS